MSTNNSGDSGFFAKIAAVVGIVCIGLGRFADDIFRVGAHSSGLVDDAARVGSIGDDAVSTIKFGTEAADLAHDGYSLSQSSNNETISEERQSKLEVPYLINHGNGWESVRVMLMKDGTKYVFNGTETRTQFDSLRAKSQVMHFERRKKKTE